ncbi:uncharacterized protein Dana_GF13640, isoform C [Drosophila ananassae]|uniref:Uncharacterized protein, isoform A n=1 Tax=Drosophila ananassae TaxID=7217 RepID=B3MGA1_DROAN|nr:uncharacterized protein LOC6496478 [Drosophila ananassae]XP_014763852.1 uncharacterized protein LOC6496478 [Drosophila ananassae]XP_014763853.1 uncharacterized protein LOC6496478 [Drosophila ananassae]XP_032306337.1 uncharacterized protein LOC6496478 [Drosophila ananassae]XP_044571641.1 uncharacterized protein LOC6496478 [Drosophila ananassae]EDV37804.1 uncharacterized protein Dana_GF13640, isoform A [Drosophila ananassae]KPU77039.1 uncharacterized protein Dana_GF13640, isoform B [Drosophi
MPICKSSQVTASKKTATDISADHVTEAAQVQRTREQAYFNSYDFDAIEVLPYDEEDDDTGDTSQGRSRSRSQSRSQSRSGSSSSRSSSAKSYSAAHDPNGVGKFAYLQRLGAFFARSGGNGGAGAAGEGVSSTTGGSGAAAGLKPTSSSENFLLPRAMLKYQSTASATLSATSAATAAVATTAAMPLKKNGVEHEVSSGGGERSKKCSVASNVSSTHTSDSGLPATGATATSAANTSGGSGVAGGATASEAQGGGGSHYSTDKSGSSGYYSSNVCSTYSLDEHIYCEPVIGGQEKIKSVAARQRLRPPLQLPSTALREVAAAEAAAVAVAAAPPHVDATTSGENSSPVKSQRSDMQDAAGAAANSESEARGEGLLLHHYSDKLRILETSIENLDRHLKTFPCLYAREHIVSFMQATSPQALDIGEKLKAYNQLPTILEQQQQQLSDDSLLDIDLDAFLLAPNGAGQRGIDNPSFLNDEQLAENNYKCAKYINSCPEDAYRLESERGGGAGRGAAAADAGSETYAKRYEDQLHFQNTRELLEDVRDKIRLLSRVTPQSSAAPTPSTTPPPDVPKELEGMIHTLKQELESYLQRMNQHSELELRQLSSGLGRQQHVVRMQNALERRRSCADLQLNAYEAVRDGVLISASGKPLSVREQIMTIRCASDPNFKMKRKSIAEIFPAAECYVESEVTTTSLSRSTTPSPASTPQLELEALHPNQGISTTTVVTQMQRNLTFHKPILAVGGQGAGNINTTGACAGPGGGKGDRDSITEWHRKKPSIWEMYYGTNRLHQSLLGKQRSGGELVISSAQPTLSYPSSRPESDFTLDLPRAEQLRLKMEKEKKFRQRCRFITTFLSLVFFLLTVMVVSLVLTRGKRMFGSMI